MNIDRTTYILDPIVILAGLTKLEANYYEFLELSRSFNGWVLTLNAQEIEDLLVDFTIVKGKAVQVPPRYKLLECVFDDITEIYEDEFRQDLVQKGTHLKKLSLYKKGWVKYTQAEKDEDWTYRVTALGSLNAEKL